MNDRFLYIIAGCNGAGKTTASFAILPEILECKEFVNADEIAKGISPFKPESVSLEAGRIMLNRIKELLNYQNSFAFETTLATKSYKNTIIEAKEKGYTVLLLYFWLQSIDLAKERVKTRFSEGGHNIESEVIERRYKAGMVNLFDVYLDIADYSLLFDNSEGKHELIAEKSINEDIRIINVEKFNQLKFLYDEYKENA
jgi:predicted ABC-type ATPase